MTEHDKGTTGQRDHGNNGTTGQRDKGSMGLRDDKKAQL